MEILHQILHQSLQDPRVLWQLQNPLLAYQNQAAYLDFEPRQSEFLFNLPVVK